MTSHVDDRIRANPELAAAVAQAGEFLAAIPTRVLGPVTADWNLATDAGGPAVEVTLTDPTGSVSGRLTAAELKDPDRSEGQLRRLWDDLLRVKFWNHMNRAQELLAAQLEVD